MNILPYEKNSIYRGECAKLMAKMPSDCIDLTVTSPPYDNLRDYNGYEFDYKKVLAGLYRVTKPGGVVVWIVADATIKGSETGTSFRQALYAMDVCGFRLHDTMIYQKVGNGAPQSRPYRRYSSAFEYMFVFSKNEPKTFNPIMVYGKEQGLRRKSKRMKNGNIVGGVYNSGAGSPKQNIWKIAHDHMKKNNGVASVSSKHPAAFPESLARDHILSWSNSGDLVFDPMCGSGTTLKTAMQNGRDYLGFDMSNEYCELSRQRVAWANPPLLVVG